jgi:hypothetical protein
MTTKKPPVKAVAKKKKKPVPGFHNAPETTSEEQMGRAITEIIIAGDVSSLTVAQRAEFLSKLALSMNLNPLSQPFELIELNGKLTIYAKKGAADQLREKHKIKTEVLSEGYIDDAKTAYFVTVKVQTPDADGLYDTPGCRSEIETGCASTDGLTGEALGNARMKASTKAKRRATLAFCGFGGLDEMEIDAIQAGQAVPGVGQPKRFIPRLTAAPTSPAVGIAAPTTSKPVDAVGTVVPTPITLPATPPIILPPIKPPVSTK